jgi:hypothetical protein
MQSDDNSSQGPFHCMESGQSRYKGNHQRNISGLNRSGSFRLCDFSTINIICQNRHNLHNWQNNKFYGVRVMVFKRKKTSITVLTKIYPPLPTSVQPYSITKTLLLVPTKNERDPPLFTGKLLIKFQNIQRNTTQVIIRHRVKILFSVISSPITLERKSENRQK